MHKQKHTHFNLLLTGDSFENLFFQKLNKQTKKKIKTKNRANEMKGTK